MTDRDDIKMCQCASCRVHLLGLAEGNIAAGVEAYGESAPEPVAGRIDDRPYCRRCYVYLTREVKGARR